REDCRTEPQRREADPASRKPRAGQAAFRRRPLARAPRPGTNTVIRAACTAGLSALLAAPLAGCAGNWQSALDVYGTAAIGLKQLIILIVAVCSMVWMLVMIALIAALWRRRDARAASPEPGRERRMA